MTIGMTKKILSGRKVLMIALFAAFFMAASSAGAQEIDSLAVAAAQAVAGQDSLAVQPVLENGSASLLCSLVEDNMGISFLPDYVTEDAVRKGTVVRLSAEDFQPVLWKQLLYRKDKWVSMPMRVVLDHIAQIMLQPK